MSLVPGLLGNPQNITNGRRTTVGWTAPLQQNNLVLPVQDKVSIRPMADANHLVGFLPKHGMGEIVLGCSLVILHKHVCFHRRIIQRLANHLLNRQLLRHVESLQTAGTVGFVDGPTKRRCNQNDIPIRVRDIWGELGHFQIAPSIVVVIPGLALHKGLVIPFVCRQGPSFRGFVSHVLGSQPQVSMFDLPIGDHGPFVQKDDIPAGQIMPIMRIDSETPH
mmetsp:Transcript_18929/g.40727  ORF Transcript_18929/g.40727 Transcript_18929/m.40727 type:complete len:221 (+) Transcript_18929:566-1228(+)